MKVVSFFPLLLLLGLPACSLFGPSPDETRNASSYEFPEQCNFLPFERWERQSQNLTFDQAMKMGAKIEAEVEAESEVSKDIKADGSATVGASGSTDDSVEGTIKHESDMSDGEAERTRAYRETICPLWAFLKSDQLNAAQNQELFGVLVTVMKKRSESVGPSGKE